MANFFQRLLGPSRRPVTKTGPPRLVLAAFGKHPGWNDHIPGIGMETEALAQLKQTMYVSGIGGRIDAGAWTGLAEEKRLEGFDHTFLSVRGGQNITGCLFSSADGLRRREYPMVLCVDGGGANAGFILPPAQSELDRLRVACRATASAEQVTTECRLAQDRLRGILAGPSSTLPPTVALPSEIRRRFLEHRDLGPDRIGLLRALHELGAYGDPARPVATGPGAKVRSCHLRLPRAADSLNGSLLLWAEFFGCAVSASTPLLLLTRAGVDWLDVIIGEPISDDFFCLQASLTALPLASQIPYDLTPELKPRLQAIEAKFLRPDTSSLLATPVAGAVPSPATNAGVSQTPPRRGLNLVIVLVVAVLVLAGGLLVWLFTGNNTSPSDAKRLAAASNSVPANGVPAPTQPAASEGTGDERAREAARLKVEAEGKRLAEAKRVAEANAAAVTTTKNEANPKTELPPKAASQPQAVVETKPLQAEAKPGSNAIVAAESQFTNPAAGQGGKDAAPPAAVKPVEDEKAQARARENDADLAQIALAQGNYDRVLELGQKWPGVERFTALLQLAATETNQLVQVNAFLLAGNYNPILTNRLPENPKFKAIWTAADGEKRLLDQANAEFAGGDYAFLQRPEVQALEAKPPFRKLLADGSAEAGQLIKAKELQAANQPQAAKDFIAALKIQKPPFVKIQQWATGELVRLAGEEKESQLAKSLFEQADYAGALALCQKYSGLPVFDGLVRSVNEEQQVLVDTRKKFTAGDYSYVKELASRAYRTKPPFSELLRQGSEEQATLGELEKLKQAGDWQALPGKLGALPAAVSGKPPFEDLRNWAGAKADAQAELRKKDPVWLDAEFEKLLVWFNIVPSTSPRIQTPEARKQKMLGAIGPQKDVYLREIQRLEDEYKKGGWLTQNDREKYLKELKKTITYWE